MKYGNPMSEDEIREYRKQKALMRRRAAKMERRGKIGKFLLLVVIFFVVFIFSGSGGIDFSKFKFNFNFKMPEIKWFQGGEKKNNNNKQDGNSEVTSELSGKFIAYVPMDDRSIHTTRLIYLAEAAGYEMKMPDSKAYKTYLETGENSYAGFNTKFGNPSKLASWLLDMEDAGCDYYILSLDQLVSGGIAGSTYLGDKDFEVYDRGADAALRSLTKLYSDKKNHIYIIDSVAGLSVIPGFMDFTAEDDALLREFTNKERPVSDLSIDKIAENYILDPNGASYTTALDLEKQNRYLAARERKLSYSEKLVGLMNKAKKPENMYLAIGIEDSGNSLHNIQKNDLLFLQDLVKDNKNPVPICDGLSSLSEEIFAKMLLDAVNKDVKVQVRYYGDSNQVIQNSTLTYSSYMKDLLNDMGLTAVEEKADMEVLVYTKNGPETREDSSKKLLNQYLTNIKNHVPTVIVNDANYAEDKVLINYLSDYESTKIPMGYLFGYSNWNGFVHSSRIAISEGVARYLYLIQKDKTKNGDRGFLKLLGYGFFEDMSYLPSPKDTMDLRVVESNMDAANKKISENLQKSNIVSNLVKYEEAGIKSIDTYNYKFSWGRVNEIDFDVSPVMAEKKHSITIPTEVVVTQKES